MIASSIEHRVVNSQFSFLLFYIQMINTHTKALLNLKIFLVFISFHISDVPNSHTPQDIQLSSSASSSGFYSNQSEQSDPSPPCSHLSESAPAGSGGMLFGPFMPDEGLELEDEVVHQNNKVKLNYQVAVLCP